jgi:tetratricopeptide (TPR) repeat protein
MTRKGMRAIAWMALVWTGAAVGWGPTTQLAMVTNALHLISKDSNIPLTRLEKDIRAGAAISAEMLAELYPDLASDPVRAIESEMYLLKAVQGGRVDAYFAYRLGVLGKLVAEITSPLRDISPTYRNLYFADVERNIEATTLRSRARQVVEPRTYFAAMMTESRARDEMILKDYQSGKGYAGVASTTLSENATRSVNAVADVWQTVLASPALAGNVSEGQLRKYVLDAYAYYVGRRNPREIDDASARLNKLTPLTPDMQARVGDLLMEAELFDRAMEEYRAVVRQDPGRRDVAEKIANYYVTAGEKALEENKLEDARETFKTAAETNPLHPAAEGLRLQAEALITARDTRLAASRDALDRADKLNTLAEDEAFKGRYAEAIALLRQADATYEEVTDEFPNEFQQRTRSQRNVRYRVQELQAQIMENAQIFSGSGAAQDIRRLAQKGGKGLETQALKALIEQNYQAALASVETQLQPALALE